MGYQMLNYTIFKKNTEELLQKFNNYCQRYPTVNYEVLRQKVSGLQEKYIAKSQKGKSGYFSSSDTRLRCDQLACISQLLPKLPDPKTEKDEEKLESAEQILLGAIIFRYLRIKKSYENPFSFFKTEEDSYTFQVLDEEFDFKNKLDEETIVSCCEAYQRYLLQSLPTGNQNVGDQFPYIVKNKQKFYKNLSEIINERKPQAQLIRAQLNVIDFVYSVYESLEKTEEAVCAVLPKFKAMVWLKLEELEREGNSKGYLTYEELIVLAKSLKPAPEECALAGLILLFPAKISKDKIEALETGVVGNISFDKYFEHAFAIRNNYCLLGAYIMALGLCDSGTEKLLIALNGAINVLGENQLDLYTTGMALKALSDYTRLPVSARLTFRCQSWSRVRGEELMLQDLDNRLVNVRKELEEMERKSLLAQASPNKENESQNFSYQ
ncbi:hypothetical protein EAS68_12765 [Legionella jordanis]|uniref:hypothetical protein n=1 Tax=Legionella jordanis TaxID=456 RepID=UPI000EFDE632|nr:hypothetical protein [Legionella jordanis]RMX15281.1 hypothetical protein EAS68_12765 [Legionella jordanis]